MGILVKNGGLLTTVQDFGREGYQEFGVSVAGVMDKGSTAIANILVGNPVSEGVLEMMFMGPQLEFTSDNMIAVTGGDLRPQINGKDMAMYQAVLVKKGDILSFLGMRTGLRGYIAFAGGLDIPLVMGSKSTHMKSTLGGYEGRKLQTGDKIEFTAPKTTLPNIWKRRYQAGAVGAGQITLRVVMGPQDDAFTEAGVHTFLNSVYSLSNEADRMGCRLEGDVIEHKNGGDIITDGIAFGAVQVPSHGKPIVMMADRQTTGGYTKIANVISVDLPLMAQSKPGTKITFKEVSIGEAQALYIEQKKQWIELAKRFDQVDEALSVRMSEGGIPSVPVSAPYYIAPYNRSNK